MKKFTNILAAVDFSLASDQAVRYALSLADRFEARLTLAHVVPSSAVANYAFPVETFQSERQAYEQARKRLPESISAEDHDRIRLRSIVKTGDVRDELMHILAEEKADLLVMGTHGRRGVERLLIGSTTESMLRRSPTPVLTVSVPRPADVPKQSFRQILYATDYSENAKTGFHYALELSRSFGAELVVLHVLDRLELWGSELIGQLPDAITHVREASVRQMEKLIASEPSSGRTARVAVIEGAPHHEIVDYADRTGADLIVLNIQSKSFLERAMLGSTAERVIRLSHVPVLAVPIAKDASG